MKLKFTPEDGFETKVNKAIMKSNGKVETETLKKIEESGIDGKEAFKAYGLMIAGYDYNNELAQKWKQLEQEAIASLLGECKTNAYEVPVECFMEVVEDLNVY